MAFITPPWVLHKFYKRNLGPDRAPKTKYWRANLQHIKSKMNERQIMQRLNGILGEGTFTLEHLGATIWTLFSDRALTDQELENFDLPGIDTRESGKDSMMQSLRNTNTTSNHGASTQVVQERKVGTSRQGELGHVHKWEGSKMVCFGIENLGTVREEEEEIEKERLDNTGIFADSDGLSSSEAGKGGSSRTGNGKECLFEETVYRGPPRYGDIVDYGGR